MSEHEHLVPLVHLKQEEYDKLKAEIADLKAQVAGLQMALKETDCTCGSEGESDTSFKDGGCIRCKALSGSKP